MAPPPAHCVCHLPRLGMGGWRYAPSPCGVLVLKKQEKKDYLREYVSFRPLAGFWFLNASPCEALWCLDKNAILRRGGVVGAKSSVRLFEKLLFPRPVLRGADSSPVHGFLRKISRENAAGQSPRRIHIIYCALIESSMNLLPSLAFWRTSSVMSAPASTMTTPLSILMVRVAFLPRRKRR